MKSKDFAFLVVFYSLLILWLFLIRFNCPISIIAFTLLPALYMQLEFEHRMRVAGAYAELITKKEGIVRKILRGWLRNFTSSLMVSFAFFFFLFDFITFGLYDFIFLFFYLIFTLLVVKSFKRKLREELNEAFHTSFLSRYVIPIFTILPMVVVYTLLSYYLFPLKNFIPNYTIQGFENYISEYLYQTYSCPAIRIFVIIFEVINFFYWRIALFLIKIFGSKGAIFMFALFIKRAIPFIFISRFLVLLYQKFSEEE